jgi:predicted DNA binding CopG/RHH family protein
MSEQIDKQAILSNICYTELVYDRINKKLNTMLSMHEIEAMIAGIIDQTEVKHFQKKGKNFYITNTQQNIRITINSNTFRVITVDRI